ncbi:nucleotidyltransferase domain-containing protein [Amycolatopsis dendrobii]|uniref:Nucleotidyltransferase domain-containing protein n=1 Tax=Amycolatopsis dendrobii TaxID=2760662 RepID=A0A7W3W5A9_9PSEU|nr:nucleotidyltransferase domain-containing protein [Amycolatopsis dendrobii]MBB1159128.1 nucleotidyltransferase domain-containing protein [Amycolatopsis dendrobii]
MFEAAERVRVRAELIAAARRDVDITGAALVGSAARGSEDRWSDIDLVLQLAEDADEPAVVARWTRSLDEKFGVADTLDVTSREGVRYRVFLLDSSLQVDLSFWPHDLFRATEDGFQLVFGQANEPASAAAPDSEQVIGMAWLYAVHARSAIGRGRTWQAVQMLDDLRDQIIALECLRHGLNPWHGREVDRLPAPVLATLRDGRAASVSLTELERSRQALLQHYLAAVAHHDAERAVALRRALDQRGAGGTTNC